ncbi:MAG: hypothetical protein ACR2LH_03365 [Thermoleophilaceae bacterium]
MAAPADVAGLVFEPLAQQKGHPRAEGAPGVGDLSQLVDARLVGEALDRVERNIAAALSGDGPARLATLLHAVTDVLDTSHSRDATPEETVGASPPTAPFNRSPPAPP